MQIENCKMQNDKWTKIHKFNLHFSMLILQCSMMFDPISAKRSPVEHTI